MNNIPRCVHTTLVSALGLLITAGTWGHLTLLTSVTGERVGPHVPFTGESLGTACRCSDATGEQSAGICSLNKVLQVWEPQERTPQTRTRRLWGSGIIENLLRTIYIHSVGLFAGKCLDSMVLD